MRSKRARDFGVVIGDHSTGPYNAITDVEGVRVGVATITEGRGRARRWSGTDPYRGDHRPSARREHLAPATLRGLSFPEWKWRVDGARVGEGSGYANFAGRESS